MVFKAKQNRQKNPRDYRLIVALKGVKRPEIFEYSNADDAKRFLRKLQSDGFTVSKATITHKVSGRIVYKEAHNPSNPTSAQLNRCKKMIDDERTSRTTPKIIYYWKERNGKIISVCSCGGGETKVKNPTTEAKAALKLRDKIRQRGFPYRIPLEQLNATEKILVRKYPGHFTDDNGYIFVKGAGRKKNFSNADFRRITKERLQELSKMFQGEASGMQIKTLQPDVMPDDTFRLGWLKKIIYKDASGKRTIINFSGNSLLSADIRCNLWFSGSDARIENLHSGLPKKGSLKYLGDLVQVEYVTAKKHLHGGRTVHFWHPMGEVTKQFPKLAVDYDGFPLAIGGGYDIWNVGIVD